MNDRELAAAFVLGELDERERAEVDRRLAGDPGLRAEIEAMRPLASDLAELPAAAWPVPEIEPAPAPAETPRAAPAPPAPRPRRVWQLRPALALAAVLAALVVGGGLGALLADDGGGGEPQGGPQLTLSALSPDSPAHGEVSMPTSDEMVLAVGDLPPSAAGQFYEVWLLGGDETLPIASFRVGSDGTATVRVPLPADPTAYRYFDVSRQIAAEGTEHSGDSVLRGPASPS